MLPEYRCPARDLPASAVADPSTNPALPVGDAGSADLTVCTTHSSERRECRLTLPGRWLPVVFAVALGLAGCSPGAVSVQGPQAQRAAGAAGLGGVCPATVVFQSNWWPQAEDGAMYRLLGGRLSVDRRRKRVSGELVADGSDTGVRLDIRSGGPANGFTPAAKMLYLDPAVTFGSADTDQIVQLAARQPVKAVVAPMDLSPLVLMFDPAQHPDFNTIGDIGQTNTKVLYFQGATYMDYLTQSGILRRSQVDPDYQGTPDRWVASHGSIVQQGFLTNEVYSYEHELPQWHRKVGWLLVSDTGYPIYPESLTIRADREPALAPCLRRLVPIIQRSIAGYLADPGPTNDLVVRLVNEYGAFPYSPARAAYGVQTIGENAIMGDGSNRTVGDFDLIRVQRVIDIVKPIFAGQKQPLPAGLTPTDLVTNAYIDPTIGTR